MLIRKITNAIANAKANTIVNAQGNVVANGIGNATVSVIIPCFKAQLTALCLTSPRRKETSKGQWKVVAVTLTRVGGLEVRSYLYFKLNKE